MQSTGLTQAEVDARVSAGKVNVEPRLNKSIFKIISGNVCTLFNLVNLLLFAVLVYVGSYKNMLFMGVVLCNLFIGIFQELRAKAAVDKLRLLNPSTARVIRDGQLSSIPMEQIVTDDIIVLKNGDQIPADAQVINGEIFVNEAFLTGESVPLEKFAGDKLLKGSFVVMGECRAHVSAVGADAYIATIAGGARRFKMARSEIMDTLKKLIRFIAIAIFPIGICLYLRQSSISPSLDDAAVKTVAALIGMIPEGLMLLTSTVLAVSVIRLTRRSVLTQELHCIEALARVDTLCLDKTGTLTEGALEVEQILALNSDAIDVDLALCSFACASSDDDQTINAIRKHCNAALSPELPLSFTPFSSEKKWSMAEFEFATLVLGAPDIIAREHDALRARVRALSSEYRVVLVMCSKEHPPKRGVLPKGLEPFALITLKDKLRESARPTAQYFQSEGVRLIVISGDSLETVRAAAERAGISDAHKAVDVSRLSTDELGAAAISNTVFARVRPEQKALLIASLRKAGHTVAMTGDGVNDILAMREADCSIGMASGSDAVKSVAQFVLVKSDFSALPDVVLEGRRTINNVQRSASLFLVKTIYSSLLAVIFAVCMLQYPFIPIQLSLISTLTIGIPSFLLALEPNHERVKGRFLKNVLKNALPAAIAIVAAVMLSVAAVPALGANKAQASTVAFCVTAFSSFMMLISLCFPKFFDMFKPGGKALLKSYAFRLCMCAVLMGAFVCGIALFPQLFSITPLPPKAAVMTATIALLCTLIFTAIKLLLRKFTLFAHDN